MELYLIRHGESENNANRTMSKDSGLSSLGREQAILAGSSLHDEGIMRLFSSAHLRGLETAQLIGEQLKLQTEVLTHLCERNFCLQETGIPLSRLEKKFPGTVFPVEVDELGWARHCEAETREEMGERMNEVADGLRKMACAEPNGKVACIIHQGSSSMLLRSLFDVMPGSDIFFRHRNCGISKIVFQEEKTILVKLNDCSHLARLPEHSKEPSA
jgi:broad specificity phosphatase PhoE